MDKAYAYEVEDKLLDVMGEMHGINREGFKIQDDGAAEWALKKIAAARKNEARKTEVCDKQIEFYKQQKEKAKKECEKETDYFLSLLDPYFESVKPDHVTKTKKEYTLPSGVLRLKFGSISFEPNKENLLKWAEENAPECVKTEKRAVWADIKKDTKIINGSVVYTPTGEILDAVTVTTKPDQFEVETR